VGLDREIRSAEASSPGLVLAGTRRASPALTGFIFSARPRSRISRRSTRKARSKTLQAFLSYELPCVIITKGQEAPEGLLVLARDKGIPVIRTRLKTAEFYRRLKPFLDDAFAPRTTVHGRSPTSSDVGLLFRGRSGIGKSECVLDLVERGTAWSRTMSFTSRGAATTC